MMAEKVVKVEKEKEGRRNSSSSSSSSSAYLSDLWTIFMHADAEDKWLMALGFLGAMGHGLATPLMMLITSKILNEFGGASASGTTNLPTFTHTVNKNAKRFLYLAAASWVVSFLEGYCWTRTGERQASRMRIRYLKAVLRQDVEYFDLQQVNTAQVVNGVSNDTLIIQDCLSEKVPDFLFNISIFIGGYVVAFYLTWRLAIVALPTMLLLIIPGIVYGKIHIDLARMRREEYDKAETIVEQAISSVRTVYSFVAESKIMAEFSTAMEGSVKLGLRQGIAKGLATGSNNVTFAIWAFMAWYSTNIVMYHNRQGGTIFAVGACTIIGGRSFGMSLGNVKYFSEASVAGERIKKMIKRVPKIDSSNDRGDVLENVAGEVEFREVEFSYPSRQDNLIFQSFSLVVPAKKTVALVGGSGSGKSTVISLLERFYDPQGGEILLDRVNIKKLQLKWLRSQIGLVSQEPALFATTIKENILFGKEDALMEEIITASKAANAHNFISQLPQGYDTHVGEGGIQISGGQKQRIAIARVALKSPKILLLDEATSALDSESERLVQEGLDLASKGRTTIVIAHRLSTIRQADTITVMQAGQIIEMGSHDDLIRDPNGHYNSLVRLQEKNAKRKEHNNNQSLFITSTSSQAQSSHSMSQRFSAAEVEQEATSTVEEANQERDAGEGKALQVPSFWRLLLLNSPEWRQTTIACLSAALFGAVQPTYSFLMGSMISGYFSKNHEEIRSRIRIYSLIFLSFAAFFFLVNIVQHYNFAVMGEKLTKRIREKMLAKVLTFEVAWFDRQENSTGSICSRLAKDANVVRSLVGDRVALLVETFSSTTISFIMGLIIAWRLALVMIVVQPLTIPCFYVRRTLLKKISKKAIKSQSESSKLAAEAVVNLRTITAFSSQDRMLQLFNQKQEGTRRERIWDSLLAGLGLGTSQFILLSTSALYYWYGGKLIGQGYITFKAFLKTFLVLANSGRVIAMAASMTTELTKGSAALGSVFEVLNRNTCIDPEDPAGLRAEKLDGSVEFTGVYFAYPARPKSIIFSKFSLGIAAGNSTALVGKSGSGKSTIIGLIERFYDPLQGTVSVDGKDIRSYHLHSLRQHIALVGQEPTLFAGTIRKNITYGTKKATEAELEEAARTANAHDFISVLKDGYDTWCGDRGVQLSGGQKQRIAIARAILKNPTILLLDEATSALDSQSESMVQEALERMMVGRTSVVVAHRLSTIQNCDLIAVLEKGVVIEKGTHASLLAKGPGGSYYSLLNLQQQPTAH